MTDRDHLAASALARHFAYQDGEWWEQLDPRKQAVYRARALDVVQLVGPIYQPPPLLNPDPDTFPRPMSKENDR